jgi:hypothetical protein
MAGVKETSNYWPVVTFCALVWLDLLANFPSYLLEHRNWGARSLKARISDTDRCGLLAAKGRGSGSTCIAVMGSTRERLQLVSVGRHPCV